MKKYVRKTCILLLIILNISLFYLDSIKNNDGLINTLGSNLKHKLVCDEKESDLNEPDVPYPHALYQSV